MNDPGKFNPPDEREPLPPQILKILIEKNIPMYSFKRMNDYDLLSCNIEFCKYCKNFGHTLSFCINRPENLAHIQDQNERARVLKEEYSKVYRQYFHQ